MKSTGRMQRPQRSLDRRFSVDNRLDLVRLCQRCVDSLWLTDHMTGEQAAESALDLFKRAVHAELEMEWVKPPDPTASVLSATGDPSEVW